MHAPRLLVSLAVASSVLLAGCAAPAGETEQTAPAEDVARPDAQAAPAQDAAPAVAAPAQEPAAQPPRNVLLQHGCDAFYSGHRVDAAYAEARLPRGLAAYPYELGGALLMLKAWTCPESALDDAGLGASQAIVYYIAVTPEAPYDAEHVVFSWYPLEIVTSSQELADAFRAWGFVVAAPGEIVLTWNEGTDPWAVRVQAQGRSSVEALVTVPSFATQEESFAVRYFAGEGDRILGAVDIVVHPGTRGGGGATLMHLTGEHAPGPAPLPGASGHQGWDEGELSYTWTPVAFGAE